MNAVQYIQLYVSGRLPIVESILITIAVVAFFAMLFEIGKWLGRRRAAKKITWDEGENISREISGTPDTPYEDSSFPIPHGFWGKYWWERLRDGFIRYWYYNSFTVIRLKNEGKVDHRAYVLKPTQMSTINWDNCTYNVRQSALLPVRRHFLMFVLEGCSEPVDLWKWNDAMALVETKVNKENYDTWSEDVKKKFGKFSFDPKMFYSKMNNRNIELLAMTSIPNMRLLFYASVAAAGCNVLILLMLAGWIPSSVTSGFQDLHAGFVEILKNLPRPAGG